MRNHDLFVPELQQRIHLAFRNSKGLSADALVQALRTIANRVTQDGLAARSDDSETTLWTIVLLSDLGIKSATPDLAIALRRIANVASHWETIH